MKADSNEPCLIHDRTSETASNASGQKHPGEGNAFPRGRVGGLVCLLLMAVLSVTAVTGPFSKAGPPAGLSVPLGLLGCYLIRDRINFRARLAAARDRMRCRIWRVQPRF